MLKEEDHKCFTCKKTFPDCNAKTIIWGIDINDKYENTKFSDLVVECSEYQEVEK
jgi:hypothetical protein